MTDLLTAQICYRLVLGIQKAIVHADIISSFLSVPRLASRSFVLSSLGFTAVAFVTGSLALWAPAFLYRSRLATGNLPPCPSGKVCQGDSDR